MGRFSCEVKAEEQGRGKGRNSIYVGKGMAVAHGAKSTWLMHFLLGNGFHGDVEYEIVSCAAEGTSARNQIDTEGRWRWYL